jgi:hypothetical protein
MKKIVLLFGGFILLLSSCAPEDPIPVEPGVAASDALSYEVIISNLLTQSSQTYTAPSNQTTIALTKAEPYSWMVKSIGEEGSTPSESEQWKFYLAGEGTINYTPFPTELISPRSGANITPDINNLVILNWNGSDVDGDLESFKVYLDQNDATTLNTTIPFQNNNNSIEVEVENNATYYWKVVAIDANGNQSSSGVYAFRTN